MIFQPVNMTGPAHRGPQLQQLAQQAAQNVMRRQRMRSMLRTSAGAAGRPGAPGGGTGLMTAQRGVHTVLSQHPPMMPNQGAAAMLGGAPAPSSDAGMFNLSGGGADFQSLPDPTDPSQSPASTNGGAPGAYGVAATNPGGALWNSASADPSNQGAGSPGGLIPLNGGLFYDPATDTVVGGAQPNNAASGTVGGRGAVLG